MRNRRDAAPSQGRPWTRNPFGLRGLPCQALFFFLTEHGVPLLTCDASFEKLTIICVEVWERFLNERTIQVRINLMRGDVEVACVDDSSGEGFACDLHTIYFLLIWFLSQRIF